MSARKPSPLDPEHGTTPNANPPCSEPEGPCPHLASGDSGDLGVARADPWPGRPVCLCPRTSPDFPNKLFPIAWYHIGTHESWDGAVPWGPAWFCNALWEQRGVLQCNVGGAGSCRTLCQRMAQICSCRGCSWVWKAANYFGCRRDFLAEVPCKHQARLRARSGELSPHCISLIARLQLAHCVHVFNLVVQFPAPSLLRDGALSAANDLPALRCLC